MGPISGRRNAIARLATILVWTSACYAYVEVPFNKEQYFGPDGPWQAVSLGIKYSSDSDYNTVNVYPSVMYDTIAALYVPTQQICSSYTYSECASGGTIGSLGGSNSSSWYTYYNTATNYYFYLNGTDSYTDIQLPNNVLLTSMVTDVLKTGEMTYPNDVTVPIEVGYGCLGGSPLASYDNLPLTLYQGGQTKSNSYGLHIGAAGLGYTGSLIFGGYNRGRVIGPVIKYEALATLSLIDVTIGVETGESPFNFESQTDLLTVPASLGSAGSLPVLLKPEYPYIYLNKETLDNVVKHLPVTFNSPSGFYLWNTDDPLYEQIVSSPAYLGFVFPSVSGNSINTTIKVPFKLLNLTLEAAASGLSGDRAYLPFMETKLGGDLGLDALLGRGFLQAAFMGTNWAQNTSFLAQAPGPGSDGEGSGYAPVDLSYSATTLDVQQGDDVFRKSWEGHWKPITSDSLNNAENSDGDGSGGLSGGAIGGIVAGVVVGLLILAAIIFFLIRRKRKAREMASQQPGYAQPGQSPGQGYAAPSEQHQQYGSAQPYYSDKPQHQEMPGDTSHRQEMDAYGGYYHPKPYQHEEQGGYQMSANIQNLSELDAHQAYEMPANSRAQ